MFRGNNWFMRGFLFGFVAATAVATYLITSTLTAHSDGALILFFLTMPASLLVNRLPDALHDTFHMSFDQAGLIGAISYALLGAIQYGLIIGVLAWIASRILRKKSAEET